MAVLETLILPAILPAAVDGIKNLISKFTGGFRPANIDEQIKLDNANVERLKALSQLDNPFGTPSQWVVDLRSSFRYITAGIAIVAAIVTLYIPVSSEVRELAMVWGMGAFSFIFGERMYLGFSNRK